MSTYYMNVAELVGSRICHDLVSPVGAIGNGVELLTLGADTASPEVGLISASVSNATARIRFFRIAFGQAAPDQEVGRAEITSILDDLERGGRVRFDLEADVPLMRAEMRAAFLAAMCLEAALPFGGEITLRQSAARWDIVGRGERLNLDDRLWDDLASGSAEAAIGPSDVQFALLPVAVGFLGRSVSVVRADETVSIRF